MTKLCQVATARLLGYEQSLFPSLVRRARNKKNIGELKMTSRILGARQDTTDNHTAFELWVALTTQNSDWLFLGDLSTIPLVTGLVNQWQHLLPIFLACWHRVRRICYRFVSDKGDISDGVVCSYFTMTFPFSVTHAVWRVPFISTMRPWKCWLEWSEHVKQGPAEDHRVVNIDVLHHKHTCIANA